MKFVTLSLGMRFSRPLFWTRESCEQSSPCTVWNQQKTQRTFPEKSKLKICTLPHFSLNFIFFYLLYFRTCLSTVYMITKRKVILGLKYNNEKKTKNVHGERNSSDKTWMRFCKILKCCSFLWVCSTF